MSEMTVAMKTAKDIEKSLVQSENRLAYVQDEVKRATQTRDNIEAEISRKSADYDIYIAKRDADSKKIRQDALDLQEQLNKDKAEFHAILAQFQKEKLSIAEQASTLKAQNVRHEAEMNNIREFIKAVQRACSVIGL